jgi:hypothetical protein
VEAAIAAYAPFLIAAPKLHRLDNSTREAVRHGARQPTPFPGAIRDNSSAGCVLAACCLLLCN